MKLLPLLAACLATVWTGAGATRAAEQPARPNILWITCEDISPDLGCYGVEGAVTPNLDRLAAHGVRYSRAFALAGVCAVSRSCLFTGMYSSSLGSQGMRFRTRLPDHVLGYSEYLRRAGYYTTNNVKTDYNFAVPREAWDDCSRKAHWRGRKPGQPFMAVFNLTMTHESQIRCPPQRYKAHMARVPESLRHDPARVRVPPFHPDVAESRRNWATYHDLITGMDLQVADILKQLDEDGLADDTIVFFYSDHGAGMPRCKKWSYDSGTRVPLIVRFPKNFRRLAPSGPGTVSDRLVSFVDFAPSVLSLAGVEIPEHMQGEAFLGPQATKPRKYVYTIRDRMAERHEMVRGVRSHRYLYLRNYMPHLSRARFTTYTQQMPTTQAWQRLAAEGKLEGPAALFFEPRKPLEELYDCEADPDNLHNLAEDAQFEAVLREHRSAQVAWLRETRDLGFLPECDMLERSQGSTPREMGCDDARYPLEDIFAAASLVGRGQGALPQLLENMNHEDPAVRFWAVLGVAALGDDAGPAAEKLVDVLSDDSSPVVRLAAAEGLLRIGAEADVTPTALEGLKHESPWVRVRAGVVLDLMGERGRAALPAVREALKRKSQFGYENRLLGRLVSQWER